MSLPYTLLTIFYFASGVAIFLLGLTVLRTAQYSSPARATALMLFFAGLGPVLSASSLIMQSAMPADTADYTSMVDRFEYLWEFYFPSLLLFSLAYPRQFRVFNSFGLLGVLVFMPYVAHLIMIMAGDTLSAWATDQARNLPLTRELTLGGRSFDLGGMSGILAFLIKVLVRLHKQLFVMVNVVYATTALFFLFRGMQLSINPRITNQLRTIVTGLTVSVVGYLFAKFIPAMRGVFGPRTDALSLGMISFSLVAGGGSVAFAVVRQEFLGIKFVLRKSIMYAVAALMFAAVYLLVVRPVSDFFGQNSPLSEGIFETGFIILAIIAFQPSMYRIEEVLERWLLKGRDNLQTRFREVGVELANVADESELESVLRKRFKGILDASSVTLLLDDGSERYQILATILGEIRQPVVRAEWLKFGEKGWLTDQGELGRSKVRKRTKEEVQAGVAVAQQVVGDGEVFVPVVKDDTCIGIVILGGKTLGLRYNSDELGQLSSIASQIGVALDNVRLVRENIEKKVLEEELQIARRVQSQLLPSESPHLNGYAVSAATLPSRYVGGDYYDFELLADNQLVLVVADVSGKGMPASLLMATLRAAVNSNEDAKRSPSVMLRRINRLLFDSTSDEEFATVFYGVVDLNSGQMRYANAGHEFPYIVMHEELRTLDESGIVLGCLPEFDYSEQAVSIPAGGSLVLYTDGVTDAATTGGENFGEARLRETLTSNGEKNSSDICEGIIDAVRTFSRGGDYHDDVTLVVLKREDPSENESSQSIQASDASA